MAINLDKLMGFHHKALQVRTERMEIWQPSQCQYSRV